MKKAIVFSIFSFLALLWSCNSDPPVINNEQNNQGDYVKIHTAESNGNKFEVWSNTAANFLYGYNNIGFKVFLNGTEQNEGYVNFLPTMYHGIGGPSHSVPVKNICTYDASIGLYSGYVIFIMYDTSAFWAADFNFNNTNRVDSSIIVLHPESKSKLYIWDNTVSQRTYVLTLMAPLSPNLGLNTVDMMFHESADLNTFSEVEAAEMFIRPWMEAMGHGSGNNVDPVPIGGGKYRGTANFTMAGEWFLYDSIKVNNTFITKTPPPKFILEVN